jgi:hypothetical protein
LAEACNARARRAANLGAARRAVAATVQALTCWCCLRQSHVPFPARLPMYPRQGRRHAHGGLAQPAIAPSAIQSCGATHQKRPGSTHGLTTGALLACLRRAKAACLRTVCEDALSRPPPLCALLEGRPHVHAASNPAPFVVLSEPAERSDPGRVGHRRKLPRRSFRAPSRA